MAATYYNPELWNVHENYFKSLNCTSKMAIFNFKGHPAMFGPFICGFN